VSTVALLDVDGTLVDTNYHHAIAWYRALRQHDAVIPVWRIHRHIGMGGDQLIAAVAGEDVEAEHGDDVRDAEKALYMAMIEEVEPLEGARELIAEAAERADQVMLASSAKAAEVEHYVDLLDAREGLPDAVSCGGRLDLAIVDSIDAVRGCEEDHTDVATARAPNWESPPGLRL